MTQYIITGEAIGTRAQQTPYSIVARLGLGVGQTVDLTLSAGDEATLENAGIISRPTQAGGAGGPSVAYQIVAASGGDDTANIIAAVNNVVAAGQANGSSYGEVWLDNTHGRLQVGGALQQGGATKGNAQIPLPVIAPTALKFILKIRGGGSAALLHWQQTVPQRSGAVLQSTLTAQAYSATFGMPAVLAGPTQEQGFANSTNGNVFNNMLVIVDGVTFLSPDATMFGMDFGCMAEAEVNNSSAFLTNATVAGGIPAPPANFMAGMRMPFNGNNDYCKVNGWTCEGWYRGVELGEHSDARGLQLLNCQKGIAISGPNPHSVAISGHASVESCVENIEHVYRNNMPFGGTFTPITIEHLSTENGTGTFANSKMISDGSQFFSGEIRVNVQSQGGAMGTVDSLAALRILRTDIGGGPQTATVPAASTNWTNLFWRPIFIKVTGGTGVVITVDGQARVVGEWFPVRPGGVVNLGAYTVAPTWLVYVE